MQIHNFRKNDNEKLQNLIAEFTLETDKFIINGCRVLKGKNGWFAVVPSVKINEKWSPVITFKNENHQKLFSEGMKECIEEYIRKHNVEEQAPEKEDDFLDEVPF